jgi:serine protease Do
VLSVNGRPIGTTELTTTLARMQPGQTVQLTVWRDRREQQVTMRLGEFDRAAAPPADAGANDAGGSRLGFQAQQITPQLARQFELRDSEGLVITSVPASGPAFRRVNPGQVLLAVNGQRVRTAADLARIAADVEPGSVVALRVRDPDLGEMVVNYRAR